jgi:3-deoxy-7-phosphoheptulonate synthase
MKNKSANQNQNLPKWVDDLKLLSQYKGGDTPNVIIAGPCAIESRNQVFEISESLSKMGVNYLRGGAFKHRTSPYSFSGLGEEGLRFIKEAANQNRQQVVSEVLSETKMDLFKKYVDVIQIGARNMRNYELMKAVSLLNKPVILKRSMDSTIKDWLFAAEHLLYYGVGNITLCERGVSTFDPLFRNMLDISSTCFIKELFNIPVIIDPSHGTGVPLIYEKVIKAFLAAGASGYMVEVHNNPAIAKCDAEQALSIDDFAILKKKLEQ